MKYFIKVKKIPLENSSLFRNIGNAIKGVHLNYGTFRNWKSKNKVDYPITYKGYSFEKIDKDEYIKNNILKG